VNPVMRGAKPVPRKIRDCQRSKKLKSRQIPWTDSQLIQATVLGLDRQAWRWAKMRSGDFGANVCQILTPCA
jgi:hypothetical protein